MPAMDYARVARFYDAYVRTDFDVAFFLREARGANRVLELMSGTGRVSLPLIEAGVRLACVDNSPEMLAILRHKLADKGLSASVHEMDVCELALTDTYDLVIVPFHSFAEILDADDQRRVLAGIRRALSDNGRFICTLHNPPVRLRSVTARLRPRGKYSLGDGQRTLFLSVIEHYDASEDIVTGTQFYEVRDASGEMQSKSSVDIAFFLHQRDSFEELVTAERFRVLQLFGDYSSAEFDQERSPFMIWVLGKREPARE